MRYLKLASAINPYTDFIELNDLNGFFCTNFKTLGISRTIQFLAIENRQFITSNKPNFKKYEMTVEILTNYSLYEQKYNSLLNFLDRNKTNGLRLYYKAYGNTDMRYCLCEIENTEKSYKLQPINITLVQTSLWLSEEKKVSTSYAEETGNLFEFKKDSEIEDYYSISFLEDNEISNYYCVSFARAVSTQAMITNNSYNNIPLIIKVHGKCVNPIISLNEQGNTIPLKMAQVFITIEENYYLEINSNILDNGVWLVNGNTGERTDCTELINNSLGSPYFYIGNGNYTLSVTDSGNNLCFTDVFFQEEYSE